MRNYRDYEKQFIGDSDIASLTMRSPMSAEVLNFCIDASYEAYIVDGDAEIGSHYNLVYECEHWLLIFDDTSRSASFQGDVIKVYRAGEMGCIIQVIEQGGFVMTKYVNFCAESAMEEYALLVGRIEALAAYMSYSKMEYIEKDIVRVMLGLGVNEYGQND